MKLKIQELIGMEQQFIFRKEDAMGCKGGKPKMPPKPKK
jgi:hypothetical protein